jgi:O-antigen/teichoic acid export membrane protein
MKKIWNLFKIKTTVLKDLGVLGSSNIIGVLITGIFWFYLANLLGVEEFGEIQYYLGVVGIVYGISLVSTQYTITVTTAKKIKIQSTLFLISLIGGFVSFTIILITLQKFDIGALVIAYIINEMALSYIIGKKLYSEYSKNILLQKILTVVFGLSFYYFFGIEGIIFGLALSYSHFIIIVYKGFKENKINFSLLKPHKEFIINNYMANLVNVLRNNLDKILIVPLAGFVTLGNYALAMQVFAILIIPSELVLKYILPQDASDSSKVELKRSIILVSVGLTIFGIVVLPVLIEYLFPEYIESLDAIRIISISAIPTTIGYLLVSKLLSEEKSKFILYGRLTSMAVFISTLLILTPLLGISGIALSFVFSTTSQTLFFLLVYKIVIIKQ